MQGRLEERAVGGLSLLKSSSAGLQKHRRKAVARFSFSVRNSHAVNKEKRVSDAKDWLLFFSCRSGGRSRAERVPHQRRRDLRAYQ